MRYELFSDVWREVNALSLLPVIPSDGSLSDGSLAALARAGDEEAFAGLVSRFSGMLHRLSVKYGNASTLEAEDLVQEGLLGLLSAVRTYRAGGAATFSTYACVCMRNRMVSALRRAPNALCLPLCEEDEPSFPTETEGDPATLLVQQEELEALHTHLRVVLTALEYQVLMRYLGAYSYAEIATDLSISRKAVDNALQRLRRKLAPLFSLRTQTA